MESTKLILAMVPVSILACITEPAKPTSGSPLASAIPSGSLVVSSAKAQIGCGYSTCANNANRCGDNYSFGAQLRGVERPMSLTVSIADVLPSAPAYDVLVAANITTHWVEFVAEPDIEHRVDLDFNLRSSSPIDGCWQGTVTAMYEPANGVMTMILSP